VVKIPRFVAGRGFLPKQSLAGFPPKAKLRAFAGKDFYPVLIDKRIPSRCFPAKSLFCQLDKTARFSEYLRMAANAALRTLFSNSVFLATVSSLLAAQLIKTVIYILANKNVKLAELVEVTTWRTGGMPSSHSALVCALAVSVGFAEGIYSNLFIVCASFALIVLRDSVGVRHSSGLQAKALNNLGRLFTAAKKAEKLQAVRELLGPSPLEEAAVDKAAGGGKADEFVPVKEIKGHSPQEVAAGVVLGVLTAIVFSLSMD